MNKSEPKCPQQQINFYIIFFFFAEEEGKIYMTWNRILSHHDPARWKTFFIQSINEADKNHDLQDISKTNGEKMYSTGVICTLRIMQ